MTRTLFSGGLLFDGTGSDPAVAEQVDLAGKAVLPGLFDCHVHVVFSTIDELQNLHTPFSYRFYQAEQNLKATLRTGITTVRDAGGPTWV